MSDDQFTEYHQRVSATFDVVFRVPKDGPGETTRVALEEAAEKVVAEHITVSNPVDIDAMRGPSGSQPIYNHGVGHGAGRIPEHFIEADWPEEEK